MNYKRIGYTLSLIMSHRIVGMLNSADYAEYLPSSVRELYLCYLPVISYLLLCVCNHNTLLGSISTFGTFITCLSTVATYCNCLQLLSACLLGVRGLQMVPGQYSLDDQKSSSAKYTRCSGFDSNYSMIDQSGNEFAACRPTLFYH